MKKIAILISGNGSNLQAFIDAAQQNYPATIALVISNEPTAYGLTRAKQANIATEIINHRDFASRDDFDTTLHKTLEKYNIDYIVLAGFMRILGANILQHYHGRILNVHPSLLPKYPGLNTFQRALDAGDTETGSTIHFVTEDLDGGPRISVTKTPIEKDDDVSALKQKVQALEHTMFPEVTKWLCEGRLALVGDKIQLEGQTIDAPFDFSHCERSKRDS
jgi:phosphoribosylglycinamide formyltransferase-1